MTDRSPPRHDGLSRPLTSQQWVIVEALNKGHATKRIAADLRCSRRTVEDHVEAIALRLPTELTADLRPIQAIIVWRRWIEWLELPRPTRPSTAA